MKKFFILMVIICLLFLFSCNKISNIDENGKSNFTQIFNNEDDDFDIQKNTDNIKNIIKNYPLVDGSTANVPLMAQIMSDYLDIPLEIAQNYSQDISTTDYAWERLIGENIFDSTKIDDTLIIAYEPSENVKEEIRRAYNDEKCKIRIVPIGIDGFVFLRNINNKIDNLTIKNIQDIYTNKITNWKELGGDDIKIEAYQRVYNSGSQTLFKKLVMKNIEPSKASKEYELGEMGGVFTTLSSYDNTANAIGYSVFYYADKMLDYPNLDFFKINGIYPSDETIENGDYPLTNVFYIAINADVDDDSEVYKLYNYILSDKGQESIRKAGYIPVTMQKEFYVFDK